RQSAPAHHGRAFGRPFAALCQGGDRSARAVSRKAARSPDCRAEREIPGAGRSRLYARQWPNRLCRHGRRDARKRRAAPRLFRLEIGRNRPAADCRTSVAIDPYRLGDCGYSFVPKSNPEPHAMRQLFIATTLMLAALMTATLVPELGLAQGQSGQVPLPPGGFKPPPMPPVKPYQAV